MILNITDLVQILKKLKGQRKEERNVSLSSIRRNLYLMKMKNNESVNQFCERFETVFREYDTCGYGVPLTEQELRAAFYQAATPVIPQLRDADLIKRTNSKEMTLEEIRSFILQ